MKIARNLAVSNRHVEWYAPLPAPSLRELARPTGVTEGVSPDGCSMPTVYTPAHIGSEIFDRLRSSKYTPSVSHSLDSSLREGAGDGWCHSTGYLRNRGGAGDFHRPYEGSETGSFYHSTNDTPSVSPSGCQLPQRGSREWLVPFNRVLAGIRGCGRFSSPLRRCEIWHGGGLKRAPLGM